MGNKCTWVKQDISLSFLFFIEKYNFLGISIVGQSNERGDGGIYIGSIMKGGAVAADGRIEPGDMLLQVSYSVFVYIITVVLQKLRASTNKKRKDITTYKKYS